MWKFGRSSAALLGGALRSGRSACCVAATHGGVAMSRAAVGPRPEALSWQNLVLALGKTGWLNLTAVLLL